MRCRHSELKLDWGGALGVGVVEGALAIIAEAVVLQAVGRRWEGWVWCVVEVRHSSRRAVCRQGRKDTGAGSA